MAIAVDWDVKHVCGCANSCSYSLVFQIQCQFRLIRSIVRSVKEILDSERSFALKLCSLFLLTLKAPTKMNRKKILSAEGVFCKYLPKSLTN